jgi:hypothetical protein
MVVGIVICFTVLTTGCGPKLYQATLFNNIDKVKNLIAEGADVNEKTQEGFTPLHNAAFYGLLEITKLLIENGADVNAKTLSSLTPLYNAADHGYLEIAKLLIENGADVNIDFFNGRRPLHCAADHGYLEIAKLLIENGADVNVEDFAGITAFDKAKSRDNQEMKKLLIENGAYENIDAKKGYFKIGEIKDSVSKLNLTLYSIEFSSAVMEHGLIRRNAPTGNKFVSLNVVFRPLAGRTYFNFPIRPLVGRTEFIFSGPINDNSRYIAAIRLDTNDVKLIDKDGNSYKFCAFAVKSGSGDLSEETAYFFDYNLYKGDSFDNIKQTINYKQKEVMTLREVNLLFIIPKDARISHIKTHSEKIPIQTSGDI